MKCGHPTCKEPHYEWAGERLGGRYTQSSKCHEVKRIQLLLCISVHLTGHAVTPEEHTQELELRWGVGHHRKPPAHLCVELKFCTALLSCPLFWSWVRHHCLTHSEHELCNNAGLRGRTHEESIAALLLFLIFVPDSLSYQGVQDGYPEGVNPRQSRKQAPIR